MGMWILHRNDTLKAGFMIKWKIAGRYRLANVGSEFGIHTWWHCRFRVEYVLPLLCANNIIHGPFETLYFLYIKRG